MINNNSWFIFDETSLPEEEEYYDTLKIGMVSRKLTDGEAVTYGYMLSSVAEIYSVHFMAKKINVTPNTLIKRIDSLAQHKFIEIRKASEEDAANMMVENILLHENLEDIFIFKFLYGNTDDTWKEFLED